MGDSMVVDVGKKATKRKRVELVTSLEEREARIDALREEDDGLIKVKEKRVEFVMSLEERESRIDVLREEVDGLIKYYKEYNNSGNVVFNVDSLKANCSDIAEISPFLLKENSITRLL
ncbi:hypothetical protein L6452_14574 [Arctium lappa]|uniref:Uncharacterized protein n=1 Tax=Arctium lappa TaxID=4217 RepID=A0ACB9CLG5_ARCLA|nr:hypothetical protein L6452_14574 [Arctium lappa]